MDKLSQLRAMTAVVADTGDINAIRQFTPLDATTNPSLLLKAAQQAEYQPLIDEAIAWAAAQGGSSSEQTSLCVDRIAAKIGYEILQIVPGRISTEVDARLSFDTNATLARARRLMDLYAQMGVAAERVLVKIASTWEGIKAAEILEREGIHCNLTLLFSFAQARACADAGVTLISPFVGRILDWHLQNTDATGFTPEQDPGVQSVRRIYQFYKEHGFDTTVMGASFRNTGQIEALAGCDSLTISPNLLAELAEDHGELPRALTPADNSGNSSPPLGEGDFRFQHNDDAMAHEKLGEGIRKFVVDQIALEHQLKARAKQGEPA
ncbi:transaldolase [Microbulbifer hydrolyticus]|uniref:Transaldolase n=1 Tax=Microbulbifer hydrolyticus TaxID=48074 RepID=A0A6P1TC67_9GAMM|nr:transaldolase [Microbulbifer hydrolyticus]MBB5213004.1 transaldolase [Microbulbifer hydrolyticus]QHQ40368.1 transaldolase [Microbulbifer hydrolyticus]